jgi:hypothetical protein
MPAGAAAAEMAAALNNKVRTTIDARDLWNI